MADTSVEVASRRLAQGRGRARATREEVELVEVVLGELDLDHPGHRPSRKAVLDDLAGRHERGRVQRQQAEAFERHTPAKKTRCRERIAPHVKASMCQPNQVASQTLR